MSRIGLQQLSTSARNSPFGTEKIVFDKNSKAPAEPLKLTKHRYQPVIPSPLVTAPFNVFSGENKENAETQTFECSTASTQTTISVPQIQPKITADDLCAEKPTANYLRVLADSLQMDVDDEMAISDRFIEEIYQLDEKIRKLDEDTKILIEVLDEIDNEQNAEVGTAQL